MRRRVYRKPFVLHEPFRSMPWMPVLTPDPAAYVNRRCTSRPHLADLNLLPAVAWDEKGRWISSSTQLRAMPLALHARR